MKNIKAIIAMFLMSSVTLFAQFGSYGSTDARRISMGNTSNAISQGVFSIGINPANILNGNSTVDLTTVIPIPSISLSAGTSFMTLNDFNYFFGGVNGQSRVLTPDDENRLNSLFSGGGLILTNTSFNLFSVGVRLNPSIGAFAFSINDVLSVDFTVPSALSQLALSGNPLGSSYNFNDTKADAWWLRSYSLSYAREITEIPQNIFSKIAAGITFKMVQGFAYVQSQQVNTSFSTGNQGQITVDANSSVLSAFSKDFGVKYSYDTTTTKSKKSPFPSPAGSGLGIDFGLSASIGDTWNFGLSVTDIGSINWDKNTALTTSSGSFTLTDLTQKSQTDSLKNKFKGNSDSIASFSTNLPTALRLGASYKFNFGANSWPGTLLVAMDINKGFNDMPGNSTKTSFSLGAEWKPMDWIPFIRTGISIGGLTGFHWAAGIGIDTGVLEFNLATDDMPIIVSPNSAKYVSVALNSRWKF